MDQLQRKLLHSHKEREAVRSLAVMQIWSRKPCAKAFGFKGWKRSFVGSGSLAGDDVAKVSEGCASRNYDGW